jgi:nicotinamidase-related amidase
VDQVDHIVEKGLDKRVEMYSAFTDIFESPSVSSSDLGEILKEASITHVYLVGLAMDYCVKWSAIDAKKIGFVTYVVREGTRAVDPGDGGWGEAQAELENFGVPIIGVASPEVNWVKAQR